MLGRKDILEKVDLKKEKVNVPEWGGEVFVSEMTAAARDEWEQGLVDKSESGSLKNLRAKLAVATIVDIAGNRIFNESDIDQVGKLSAAALQKVCLVAQRLSGLREQDQRVAEGNLNAGQAGDSISS